VLSQQEKGRFHDNREIYCSTLCLLFGTPRATSRGLLEGYWRWESRRQYDKRIQKDNEPSGSIKYWQVLEWLHNWQLLKRGSDPRVSECMSESFKRLLQNVLRRLWSFDFICWSANSKTDANCRQSITLQEKMSQCKLDKASPLIIGTIRAKRGSLWEPTLFTKCPFVRAYVSVHYLLIKFLLLFGNTVRTHRIYSFNFDMITSSMELCSDSRLLL
jgi:hypothetical protein